jgi:predicted hydrocarbon binding protein
MTTKKILTVKKEDNKRTFVVAVTLQDKPGALMDASKFLAVRGVNIIEGYFHPSGNGLSEWVFTAYVPDVRLDANFIKDLLLHSSLVKSVEILDATNGIAIDSMGFPTMTSDNRRVVIFDLEELKQLFLPLQQRSENIFDTVRKLGELHAKSNAAYLFQPGKKITLKEVYGAVSIYTAMGWGKAKIVEFNLKDLECIIDIEDNFELYLYPQSKERKENCWFATGFLKSIFEQIFKTEFECVEVLCVSSGSKECRFALRRKQDSTELGKISKSKVHGIIQKITRSL